MKLYSTPFFVVSGDENIDLDIEYTTENYSGYHYFLELGIADQPALIYFSQFDSNEQYAVVDERAPAWYQKLVALHEHVTQGEYGWLVPTLLVADDNTRSCIAEQFIIEHATQHRREYIEARIKILEFALQYIPIAKAESVNNSLRLLRSYPK